jgi:hypothetical protein
MTEYLFFNDPEEKVLEQQLDELIEAGWNVLETDFDPVAFIRWKEKAVSCLATLLGPEHHYTTNFSDYVSAETNKSVLIGGGILTAAKHKMSPISLRNICA